MRIVRFAAQGTVRYGVLQDDTIGGLRGTPFTRFEGSPTSFTLDDSTYSLHEVTLLAPSLPSKVVCLGLNYRSHAEETGLPIPSVPLIFLKPSTAIIGPGETIVLPRLSRRVDYEGELGVVIGRQAKDVPEDEAGEYILGYTCFNDVTERIIQGEDGQWTRAKSYDTFAPIGPWIETDLDPNNLRIETHLNGDLRQSARTSDLIFGVSQLVSFISEAMTLLPGDVIATGTPSGIGPVSAGDVVEVSIDNIGTLRNCVVSH